MSVLSSTSSSSSQIHVTSMLLDITRINRDPRCESKIVARITSFLRRDEIFGRGEGFGETWPLASVNKAWHSCLNANVNLIWKSLLTEQLLPGIEKNELPMQECESVGRPQVDYRRAYTEAYPKVISSDFYWDKFKARAWPKIAVPENLRGQNLVFHPEYLSIEIPEDSTLGLNEKGVLTKTLAKHATIPSVYVRPNAKDGKIELRIPNTPINISNLTLLKNKMGFTSESWSDVLVQHGNNKESSHWTAPNNQLMACGELFPSQSLRATEARLKIMTFADTSLFYLLTFVRSRKWPCGDGKAVRTSTVVFENGDAERAFQVTLCCVDTGRLDLELAHNESKVGVAVGSSEI